MERYAATCHSPSIEDSEIEVGLPLTSFQIKQFISCCGGLPAPECADNPLGYKFSWSARGVLLALLSTASYFSEGKKVVIAGSELMDHAHPYYISPAYAFVAYPNRDSNPFREYYRIPEAETVVRNNLRYQGFTEFVKALVNLGWMDTEKKEWLTQGLTWAQATQKVTGAADAAERCVSLTLLILFRVQAKNRTDPWLHASKRFAASPVNLRVTEL